MSTITVEWGLQKDKNGLDFLMESPVPLLEYYQENKNSAFRKCPSYNNYFKNTFVVLSPIDFEVEINKKQSWCNVITPPDFPKEYLSPRFGKESDSPYPIFSVRLAPMVLTCKEKDVYVEQIEPTLEWNRNPNIRIINGSFNIHRWVRPFDLAFEQKEGNINVKFSRGQPLFYFKFNTNDPNDRVLMKRIIISDEIENDIQRCTKLKSLCPARNLNFLYAVRQKFIDSLK